MKNCAKMVARTFFGVCLVSLYSGQASGQTVQDQVNGATVFSSIPVNITQKFKPSPSKKAKLDFENWDHFLDSIILYMGPAVRKRAPKVMESGTRIVARDDSTYRYEGNKVVYTYMNDAEKAWLKGYVRDLESLANKTDVTTLSREDQLAFWYNLHNSAIIDIIADYYPVKFPERIKPLSESSGSLHEAKIFNISGVPLSLRDIREKIVYPNWKNPLVIYGFHHGNLGGPSIATAAYDRDNLFLNLRQNADEFINSFRSYHLGKISVLYRDVSPHYFPAGEADIRAHFRKYMRPDVYKYVETYDKLKWHKPFAQVADVAGGVGFGNSTSPVARVGQGGAAGSPPAFTEAVSARAKRIVIARERGYFSNEVIIEDIESGDTDLNESEK